MAFLDTFDGGKKIFNDLQTGREVWQMTSGEYTSHAPYTYCCAFSQDERYIVYSSNRTGDFQLYRMEVQSGKATRLTDIEDYQHMGLMVGPSGDEVYFIAGTKVWAINIETGNERLVTDCSPLGVMEMYHRPCISSDGKQILLTYRRLDGRMALAIANPKGSSAEEIYIFNKVKRLAHILNCPTDNDIVTYVPLPDHQDEKDLPSEKRARTWKLNLKTLEAEPFLIVPPGYRATHEYWSLDGSRLYFHMKHVPNWIPASIGSIPIEGGEIKIHFTSDDILLGHSSINSGQTQIISDSQAPRRNELILIDIITGNHEILCWPNASGASHPNHVHPSFSPSGTKVIYTSDNQGWAQVYIVPLKKCKKE